MRKPVLWTVVALVGVAVVVAVTVLVVNWTRTSGPIGASAECSVPAVAGAPVTVVVEGQQSSGAGAAGNAAAGASPAPATSVTSAPDVFLDAVQLQHASTINAVGLRKDLPERARIIAVATAWQESKLRNLPGGDLDSVGLFQQRPSQGWGTADKLIDPVYAAGKFYDELVKVPGWQSMSLTRAAQEVQFSAFPDAYAQWEPNATTLVRELSGAGVPALSCVAGAQPPTATPPKRPALAGTGSAAPALAELLSGAEAELGGLHVVAVSGGGKSATVTVELAGEPADRAARALGGWFVAHATASGVAAVSVQGRQWRDHAWQNGPSGDPAQITVTVG